MQKSQKIAAGKRGKKLRFKKIKTLSLYEFRLQCSIRRLEHII